MAAHRALRGEPHPVRRGVWRSQIRDGTGKVISKTYEAKTKREADSIHHAFYAAVKGGEVVRNPTTLIETCDAWLATKLPTIKPSTHKFYAYTIDRYIRAHPIARTKLTALTTRALDAHYQTLEAGARDAHRSAVLLPLPVAG